MAAAHLYPSIHLVQERTPRQKFRKISKNFERPFTRQKRISQKYKFVKTRFGRSPTFNFSAEKQKVRQLLSDISERWPLRNAPKTVGNALEWSGNNPERLEMSENLRKSFENVRKSSENVRKSALFWHLAVSTSLCRPRCVDLDAV